MVDYRIRMRPGDTRPDVLWEQISDDHAIRIGRFIAAWGLIEFKLETIIWHLIRANKHDLRPLTARLDARPKKEAIDQLFKLRVLTDEQEKAWAEAKNLLGELTKARSWIAHGLWMPMPFEATGTLLTRKGKAPDTIAKFKPISVKELDRWLTQAAQTVSLLNLFLPCEPTPSRRKR